MDSEIKEIKVNGVDYIRKDAVPDKKYEGDVKIVILQRGWVYVGRYTQNNETMMCELNQAACVRVWGTTKGLPELKDGPTSSTKIDLAGKVTFHLLTTIAIIDCDEASWKKHLC